MGCIFDDPIIYARTGGYRLPGGKGRLSRKLSSWWKMDLSLVLIPTYNFIVLVIIVRIVVSAYHGVYLVDYVGLILNTMCSIMSAPRNSKRPSRITK